MKQPNELFRIKEILEGGEDVVIAGLSDSGKMLTVGVLQHLSRRRCLVVFHEEKRAHEACREISAFAGRSSVAYLPRRFSPNDDAPRQSRCERALVLTRLILGEELIVVSTVAALWERTVAPDTFKHWIFPLSRGSSWEREDLVRLFVQASYRPAALVENVGEFSVRGSIVDIFIPLYPQPVRMEFVGDEIESLRFFDVETQRSEEVIAAFTFSPVAEAIITAAAREKAGDWVKRRTEELAFSAEVLKAFLREIETANGAEMPAHLLPFFTPPEQRATVMDFWGDGFLIVVGDEDGGFASGAGKVPEVASEWENGDVLKLAPSEEVFVSRTEQKIPPGTNMVFWGDAKNADAARQITVHNSPFFLTRDDKTTGLVASLAHHIRSALERGEDVLYFCRGEGEQARITGILGAQGLSPEVSPATAVAVVSLPACGRFLLLDEQIRESFFYADKLCLSDASVFGKKPAPIKPRRGIPDGIFLRSFQDVKVGDYLVHIQHGIGIYRGLKTITTDGVTSDFFLIEYLDGDKLYLPIYRLEAVQKYVGAAGVRPKCDKLGSKNWENTKRKAKEAIGEIAKSLVSIYAQRGIIQRHPFDPTDLAYEEFCAKFPYQETPDQFSAIADVNNDLDGLRPMDRLLCGDAGFGKTEVALRAAYRVAISGRQVVVLAPTTILCEQHLATFAERFRDYPVRVESLNRLKNKKEQAALVTAFNSGVVDILIGTHRVLQSDVLPKNLGLLVIDEEQSFGVHHKEKLKKLKTDIDVLTLSATPIPRTLHLGLIGIRDLSVINSPPMKRLPVTSKVFAFDEEKIAQALETEIARGGQAFFIHDRINSLPAAAKLVERLVPLARVGVVHGRMSAHEIEAQMARFIQKRADILVCTTIVAGGVDIPAANTIVINRADRLGLAQLYQLRGRVGRSFVEAYAHFILPKGATDDARKRVFAVANLSPTGAGWQVSSYDLELRGAGNILGVSQSGHVSAVGYELYTQMMEEAISELKGVVLTTAASAKPEINLGVEAYIPPTFVHDEATRVRVYKMLSLVGSQEELQVIRESLRDTHGALPRQVENLLSVIALRNKMEPLGVRKATYSQGCFSLTFTPGGFPSKRGIAALARNFQFRGDAKSFSLSVTIGQKSAVDTFQLLDTIVDFLSLR